MNKTKENRIRNFDIDSVLGSNFIFKINDELLNNNQLIITEAYCITVYKDDIVM